VAVGSNNAFAAYCYLEGQAPVLLMHLTLLPLNALRLWQACRFQRGPDGSSPSGNERRPAAQGATGLRKADGMG
jgi:hypothetical protein